MGSEMGSGLMVVVSGCLVLLLSEQFWLDSKTCQMSGTHVKSMSGRCRLSQEVVDVAGNNCRMVDVVVAKVAVVVAKEEEVVAEEEEVVVEEEQVVADLKKK